MKLADLKDNNTSYSEFNNIYIDKYFELYPKSLGNDPEFYLNRCDAISSLFKKMLQIEFNIQSARCIVGKSLNYNHLNWCTEPSPTVQKNISNNKKNTAHVVVLVNDVVYDLSSKQFYPGEYSIYTLAEFKRRWKYVTYLNLKLYSKSYWNDFLKHLSEVS